MSAAVRDDRIHTLLVQDARLGITARLAEMNARHRAERHEAYGALNSLMACAFLLAVFAATIFVWAA